MKCETYSEKKDQFQNLFKEGGDGQCDRKATRLVTLENGNGIRLCGHCARSWKQACWTKSIEKI